MNQKTNNFLPLLDQKPPPKITYLHLPPLYKTPKIPSNKAKILYKMLKILNFL